MRTYGFVSLTRILAVGQVDGIAKLMEIDVAAGAVETEGLPIDEMQGLVAAAGRADFDG
jgi:hypothetical protein